VSGDDRTAFAFIAQGGNGCISVTSNVAPGLCRSMYLALKRSQISQAQRLAIVNMKLTDALFSDTNPVPVKYALSLLHVISPRVRLPLVEPSNATKAEIASVLAHVCEQHSDYVLGRPGAVESNAQRASLAPYALTRKIQRLGAPIPYDG
jgi:4-hydroxy-tetrahydrodipicolinate synthase